MYFSSALTVSASIFLFSTSARSAALQSRALSGEATFYGGNLHGGACSFSTYTLPSGVFGTALSDSNWDNAANCGACVSVTGPDGSSITAMIVDECPGCGQNHLDLFPDAFSTLADPSKGVIDVTWSYVDCPITTPLQLHNKEGVSQYWFSMQVVNTIKPVASLFVSTDGGETWTATQRQAYNFFQYSSGFGTTTVDVMIASTGGDEVIVKNVQVSSGGSMTTTLNFGAVSDGDADPAPSSSSSLAPKHTPTSMSMSMSTPKPKLSPSPTTTPLDPNTSILTTSAEPILASTTTMPPPPPPPATTPADYGSVSMTPLSSTIADSVSAVTNLPTSTPYIPHPHKASATWTTMVKTITTTKEAAPKSTTTVYVYEDCKA